MQCAADAFPKVVWREECNPPLLVYSSQMAKQGFSPRCSAQGAGEVPVRQFQLEQPIHRGGVRPRQQRDHVVALRQ